MQEIGTALTPIITEAAATIVTILAGAAVLFLRMRLFIAGVGQAICRTLDLSIRDPDSQGDMTDSKYAANQLAWV